MNSCEDTNSAPPGQSQDSDPWLDARFSLRKDLKFDIRVENHTTVVVIEDPVRSKFFQVGKLEYCFLSEIDGEKTARQIVENWGGNQPLTIETASVICRWLYQSNLTNAPDLDNSRRLEQQADAVQKQNLIGMMNPISFKIKLFNPNLLLKAMLPALSWLFSRTFLFVWLSTAGYAGYLMHENWERLSDASMGILSNGRWLWLLVIWIVLKVVHETAHGIACRRYGGDVTECGVLFLLFTPMAFVNVTSSWRFHNRWHRIVVAGAGMYVELFISFLAIIVWSYSETGILADICFNIFIMSSVTTLLFNANPLMRFDGYYMLTDGLGITNLYSKGTRLMSDRIKSWFFGIPTTPNICQANEFALVAVYGTLAFFWKILISFSLVIGASVLFYGAGKALAVLGVGLWFGMPLWKQIAPLVSQNSEVKINSQRVVVNTALIGAFAFCLFFILKGPGTKSAPAIVQFKNETPVRSEADGFVKEILVADGEAVTEGQLLMTLDNPMLALEILELQTQADAAKIEARVHRQNGEISLSQAATETGLGLEKQIREKQKEQQSLEIRAPSDGFVIERNLATRIGSFAKRGDQLLTTAQQRTKEVVVAVDQQDWESLKDHVGTTMRVAVPSLPVFESQITRISPRASDVPSHAAFCASAGGPLPTRISNEQDGEDQQRLLTPHFAVDLMVEADTGTRLHSGQRGRAFFSTKKQSLGAYLFLAAEQWLQDKIEIAIQTAAF